MIRKVEVERALAAVRAARREVTAAEARLEPEPEPQALPLLVAGVRAASRHLRAARQRLHELMGSGAKQGQ
jgi:hypothetical protein